MHIPYNLYNLEASFRQSLIAENYSPVSIKNYLSDLRHFFGWLNRPISTNLVDLLSEEQLQNYKNYLEASFFPTKTINRRLSTIRKFCSLLIKQGLIKENPAKKLKNSSVNNNFRPIVDSYEKYLVNLATEQSEINFQIGVINEMLQIIDINI